MPDSSFPTVYPLLFTDDVGALADVLIGLGFTESWRADEGGVVEHAELRFATGVVSINIRLDENRDLGPSGLALRCATRAEVDEVHRRVQAAGLTIVRPLDESFVAYGFTVLDPDGNQLWFHHENGNLDALRSESSDSGTSL